MGTTATEAERLRDGIRDLWETWMDDEATWVEVAGKLDDLHSSLDRPPPCTGVAATFCPRHGDCTCEPGDDGTPSFDDRGCPLHDPMCDHAE